MTVVPCSRRSWTSSVKSVSRAVYLDASALVKLAMAEPETAALRTAVSAWPRRASSRLSVAEVLRAAQRRGKGAMEPARRVLAGTSLMSIDRRVIDAVAVEPASPAHARRHPRCKRAQARTGPGGLRQLRHAPARCSVCCRTAGRLASLRLHFSQPPTPYALPGVPPTTMSVVGDSVASNLRLTGPSTATALPAGTSTSSPSSVARAAPHWMM